MSESDYAHWRLETDEKGILWLGFDQAGTGTNTLGSAVLEELSVILDRLVVQPPHALIVHSRKDNGFAAGADVKEFTHIENEPQAYELIRRGQLVLNRLAALPCPTVAMIHGFALGGGLELALACRYRIAADTTHTKLGFPEVKLGIHPGFGGTVRSVAVMGVFAAMKLMLTGRSLGAGEAKARGLVDKVASAAELHERAINLALNPRRAPRASSLQRLLSLPPARPLVARILRRQLAGRVREEQYPAPYAMVRLWRLHGGRLHAESFEAEAHSIAHLMCGETARNLVRVFFLQNRLKALGRTPQFVPRQVQVIGAGTMGGDIAALCAARGIEVRLQDREASFVEAAIARSRKFFERKSKDAHEIGEAAARLKMDLAGDDLPEAELVIEAITEKRDAKLELFRDIEPRMAEDALLATNTSSIPLETLADALQRPERLVGLHFFNPVAKMPLVEVVSMEETSAETRKRALAVVHALGKLPVPVRSAPGFLVNRILAPYLTAAFAAHDRGVAPEAIDRAAEDFGMPMGPLELADTVGLDVALAAAESLEGLVPVAPPQALRDLVAAGSLGRKTGQGIYAWRNGKAQKQPKLAATASPLLQDLLILPFLNEAVRCLREKIVEDADLLDAGMIFGTGFAPFRGGPLHYARRAGAQALAARLNELRADYGPLYSADPGWNELANH
ncbi:MAG TPA: 3-hydroxyacyl-CoA dehydrogenase NAD-binding domain-containing protein [Gammaproteobacteria bacterium]|nr:3-hydroxyacyl-CoA dehydrogenase NAD-binding domain-containing protein [Gammaproteobacteria bacterium]